MTATNKINNTFAVILSTTLALKLILSVWFPVTGDEAYFTLWGKFPDYGFYDHPPMLGWWLTAQLWFGDALWWLRHAETATSEQAMETWQELLQVGCAE